MALFIVACGTLLMIGGAISLLMGFDIVMTDRGAAMAIGGTVALAGGVVAVGIGGVLVRLSQILRSLEQRPAKAKTSVPDRPVVAVKQPDPQPVPTEHSSSAAPAIAAGVVAAGTVAGGIFASRETVAAAKDVPLSVDEPPREMPESVLENLRTEVLAEQSAQPTAPADLEDELARALAEADERPVVSPDSVLAESPPPKSEGRRRSWLSRNEPEQAIPPALPEALASDSILPEPSVAETRVTADEMTSLDELVSTPEVVAEVSQQPEASEEVPAEASEEFPGLSEEVTTESAALPDDDDLLPAPPKPKVLGTYNVGGRTYSMYADGAVEAVTESGIERFASMDDLRKHLAAGRA